MDPNNWKTGTCPITRDKYYAFLKHRSQAVFRGEVHTLTWEQWQSLWHAAAWERRGRRGDDLCLGRLNWDLGWEYSNVATMTKKDHFIIKKAYNAQQRLQSI